MLLQAASCTGWSTKPFTIDGLEKVHVPFFKNNTFFRRLEQDLTREVIARIHERPDLILADEKAADLIIKGTIIDYRLNVLSEDDNDRVIQAAATTVVEVQIVRASNGKVLRKAVLRDSAEYFDLFNQSLELTRSESFNTLSRKVVALLEEGF